jgi:cytochrome o ubiquinol oxidase subunit 2
MPGMSTQINLMATKSGIFSGLSANISGEGFSGMTFKVRSTSNLQYQSWVRQLSKSENNLTLAAYNSLSKPTQNSSIIYFSAVTSDLYGSVINKYMVPSSPNVTLAVSKNIPSYSGANMNGMIMP